GRQIRRGSAGRPRQPGWQDSERVRRRADGSEAKHQTGEQQGAEGPLHPGHEDADTRDADGAAQRRQNNWPEEVTAKAARHRLALFGVRRFIAAFVSLFCFFWLHDAKAKQKNKSGDESPHSKEKTKKPPRPEWRDALKPKRKSIAGGVAMSTASRREYPRSAPHTPPEDVL